MGETLDMIIGILFIIILVIFIYACFKISGDDK